jgi:hypothetical protein
MKTKKIFCLGSMIVFVASAVFADDTNEIKSVEEPSIKEPKTEEPSLEEPAYRPLTIGVEAGTTGVGGAATLRFGGHFGVRAGMNYFSYSYDSTIEGIPYDATFRPMSETVGFNFYPFKKRSFYISAGIFFNQNELTGTSSDTTTPLTIDGITFPAGTVGTLHMKIEQQPVNPYISIGGTFFYFDKKRHWSLSGELGVVYAGEPEVSLTRTGGIANPAIDAAITAEEQELEDYAERYQFYPILKLALNYSF